MLEFEGVNNKYQLLPVSNNEQISNQKSIQSLLNSDKNQILNKQDETTAFAYLNQKRDPENPNNFLNTYPTESPHLFFFSQNYGTIEFAPIDREKPLLLTQLDFILSNLNFNQESKYPEDSIHNIRLISRKREINDPSLNKYISNLENPISPNIPISEPPKEPELEPISHPPKISETNKQWLNNLPKYKKEELSSNQETSTQNIETNPQITEYLGPGLDKRHQAGTGVPGISKFIDDPEAFKEEKKEELRTKIQEIIINYNKVADTTMNIEDFINTYHPIFFEVGNITKRLENTEMDTIIPKLNSHDSGSYFGIEIQGKTFIFPEFKRYVDKHNFNAGGINNLFNTTIPFDQNQIYHRPRLIFPAFIEISIEDIDKIHMNAKNIKKGTLNLGQGESTI